MKFGVHVGKRAKCRRCWLTASSRSVLQGRLNGPPANSTLQHSPKLMMLQGDHKNSLEPTLCRPVQTHKSADELAHPVEFLIAGPVIFGEPMVVVAFEAVMVIVPGGVMSSSCFCSSSTTMARYHLQHVQYCPISRFQFPNQPPARHTCFVPTPEAVVTRNCVVINCCGERGQSMQDTSPQHGEG